MPVVDLSKYKVVYGERVIKALALMNMEFEESVNADDIIHKPKIIEIMVINEKGNIELIKDEAWMFQFIPIIGGKDAGSI